MENYENICQIGKGNFGSIFKIVRKSDSKIMVWKELDYGRMSEKEKQQIVSEVNILRELKHPNIVRYYDRIIDKKNSKIFIIMEYCEGGDLGQLIKRCKKTSDFIQEDVIWKILTQIILAINSCHNRKEGKILHRDIKPSNIFLDNENNIKLGDFGLSRVLSNESNFAYSHVGTPYYMSPEQIDDMRYNDKSDIWSLGCFLYELTTFHPPFEAKNHVSLAMKIKSGKVEKINSRYSEELWRVITWMLNIDHHFRPSIEELLNMPQITLRLREKKLKDSLSKLKQIEENLKVKEEMLNNKEKELDSRDKALKEKEEALNEREKSLNEYSKKIQLMSPLNSSMNANINESKNMYNGTTEDYNTNSSKKNNEINIKHSKSKSVYNSLQNLDYYLPHSNLSKNDLLKQTSCEIDNNPNHINSFKFDPSLYHDNDYPSSNIISRQHSNQNLAMVNKSLSNAHILIGEQILTKKEIKGRKVCMTKRSSTPRNLPNNNNPQKQMQMEGPTYKRANKKSNCSVNSVIDHNNSINSTNIKKRPLNIPR